jgi:tetratricopeptide (TPR) repeat protein
MAKQEETAKVQIQEFDIDQFKNGTISLFEKYKKIITIVGVSLAVIIGGILYYYIGYLGPKEKKASEDLFLAEQYFGSDSFQLALTGRNLTGQQGNFTGLLDVIKKHGSTTSGNRACFMAGAALLHTGKFEDAAKYLTQFSSSDALMQSQAYGMLGDAKSELNKFPEALDFYLKAANHYPNDVTTPIQLRKAALLLGEKMGKPAEALKHLNRIKTEFPKANRLLTIDVEKDIARYSIK